MTQFEAVLQKEMVIFTNQTKKDVVLSQLIEQLSTSDVVHDKAELRTAIFEREALMSTGIGNGVGIPHVRIPSVDSLALSVAVCETAVNDYESMDDEPVWILFMIAAAEHQHVDYLKLLAAIGQKMKDFPFRQKLRALKTAEEVYELLIAE